LGERQEEIEKRRQRGRSEGFTITVVPSPIVKKYTVQGTSSRSYQVIIDRDMNLRTCDCHDFLRSGLGTCKHIEAVLFQVSLHPAPSTGESDMGPSRDPFCETALGHVDPSSSQATSPETSSGMPRHVVCFDVETQNSFDDVGGRKNFSKLRLSVVVLYDELLQEYFVYDEKEASQLVDHLFSASLVVGYNLLGFDYEVLQPYTERELKKLPTLDLMHELAKSLGFRVKLDSVVNATLGARKTGHGLQAIEWFRAGEMKKLTEYCREDVRLTYELYRFGVTNGFVHIDSRGTRQRVLVGWK
jgi:DEAD/DEAH box helicase domain-containing protein